MKHAVVLFLVICAASLESRGQTADNLVLQGRSFLAAKNITNANSRFAAAVLTSPAHQTANALYAATRLLSLPHSQPAQDMMDRLGMSVTNRDIYKWTSRLPKDTNGVPVPPNDFNAMEAVAFFRTNAIPSVTGALENLAKVTDPNFILNLTSNETRSSQVTLDYGDIQMLRALLHGSEFFIYTVNSYNFSAQLNALYNLNARSLFTIDHLLANYPLAFTFVTTNDLQSAKNAFQNGVDRYLAASDFIRKRSTNVIRLFNYDREMALPESQFRQTLIELRASWNGPVSLTYVTNKANRLQVNLGRAFDGSAPLRSMLPDFHNKGIVLGSLPDPTLHGIVFGLSESDIYNFLASNLRLKLLPNFRLIRHFPDGRLQLDLNVASGRNYAIEASTNLATWIEITTATSTNGLLTFVDPASGGMAGRFYRAVELSTFHPARLSAPPRMVWIAPGTFTIGSPTTEKRRGSDETQHIVTLTKGFYMGKYEVTQGEYLAEMGNNPSYFNGVRAEIRKGISTNIDYGFDLNRPVEQVSWNDATNYFGKLAASERAAGRLLRGWVYRLPTEAEWEYACRAGTSTAFHYSNALRGGMANFWSEWEYDPSVGDIYVANQTTYLSRPTTVGSYQPNGFGLYDMHGDVWEWCLDWYGTYPSGSVTNPVGPATGSHRVYRGGSWRYVASACRSANRISILGEPDYRDRDVGFRSVLALGQ